MNKEFSLGGKGWPDGIFIFLYPELNDKYKKQFKITVTTIGKGVKTKILA